DHGFGHGVFGVNVTDELIKAKLKAGPDSDDVVVASSGQAMLLHVRDRNPERIGAIVRFLQRQPWAGGLFGPRRSVAGGGRDAVGASGGNAGRAPGTFALDLVRLEKSERAPDIALTFPWSSAPGPFGAPGTDYTDAATTGPLAGAAGNHGSMSPWTVRNTFIAWGPDFKRGTTVRTPASNVDLTPTLLALMNLDKDVDLAGFDGRALREAFADGPDEEQVPVAVRTYFVETADGSYRAALQVTELERQRYIDKSWRIR